MVISKIIYSLMTLYALTVIIPVGIKVYKIKKQRKEEAEQNG